MFCFNIYVVLLLLLLFIPPPKTLHWRLPGDVLTSTIDYWHATATDTPYRIAWEELSPVILEFSGVVAGFDDVPNMDYFLAPPSSCSSATVSAPRRIARTQKHDPVPSTLTLTHKEERDDAGIRPPRSPKVTGKAWPPQWHAISHYTGNDFGFGQDAEEGEPSTVPFSLTGHYYYDWVNQRECNVWVDVNTGARTNTLIVNGTFHIITLATNSCQLVPTYPVNGALKPEWPTRLPYRGMQYILVQSARRSYIKTNHYLYDALGAGNKDIIGPIASCIFSFFFLISPFRSQAFLQLLGDRGHTVSRAVPGTRIRILAIRTEHDAMGELRGGTQRASPRDGDLLRARRLFLHPC